jgi:hypothetical protein
VRRLAGKTITVSFWANVAAGSWKVGIGMRQSFGSGGSPSAVVDVPATAITLTTTQARYSVTIAMPSIAGKTLGTTVGTDFTRMGLYLSAGANTNAQAGGIGVQSGTFVFWGVQLEIGSVATPLEKLDPRIDLANCQRFYAANVSPITFSFNSWGVSAFQSIPVFFPVPLRASPTVVIGGGSGNTNISAVNVLSVNPGWFNGQAVATATGGSGITVAGYTASADL